MRKIKNGIESNTWTEEEIDRHYDCEAKCTEEYYICKKTPEECTEDYAACLQAV